LLEGSAHGGGIIAVLALAAEKRQMMVPKRIRIALKVITVK
jgi:hypothetical protein